MTTILTAQRFAAATNPAHLGPRLLGVLFGIVAPAAMALGYLTLDNFVEPLWFEQSRSFEIIILFCELLVIIAAAGHGWRIGGSLRNLPRDIVAAIAVLVPAMFAASLLVSHNPGISVSLSVFYVLHGVFALAVGYWLALAARTSLPDFVTCVLAGLLINALMIALWFCMPLMLGGINVSQIGWSYAVPGWISVRHFGTWTGAIATLMAADMLFRKMPRAFGWRELGFFLTITMTIWSGTRAAVLGFIVALVCVAIVAQVRRDPHGAGRILLLSGLACIPAWLLIPYGSSDFMLYVTNDMVSAQQASGGRLALWQGTWDQFLASPLLGWGTGSTYWMVTTVGWTHTQPHNTLLLFLISWGLVGTLPALWILGRATAAAVHRAGRDPMLLPYLAGLAALLFNSLLEGMFYYPRFIVLIVIFYAIILSRPEAKEPARQARAS